MLKTMQNPFLPLPTSVVPDEGQGHLPRFVVSSDACSAHIYLHGAHVTHWQPQGHAPVLWMSQQSAFATDKPIRGGVPICFPWFGPKADDNSAPMHGLARTDDWQLREAQEQDGATRLVLVPDEAVTTKAGWPQEATVEFIVTVGSTLEMEFHVANQGQSTLSYEIALHTYFAVSDIRQIEISGTEGATYFDKVAQQQRQQEDALLRFEGETDRLYNGTQNTCTLRDPGLKRQIVVEKSGSNSTVIWNPWIDKAGKMPDFGDEEWNQMVCIETANAGADAVKLAPGETHITRAHISVQHV
jgi:glucose-6-phosphate 1-epimerase